MSELKVISEQCGYCRGYGRFSSWGKPSKEPSDRLCVQCEGKGIRKTECPPHSWDRSGERCEKCGDKDWMT